jgi:hypothetical protein
MGHFGDRHQSWPERHWGVVPEVDHERSESLSFSQPPPKSGAKPSVSTQSRMLF